MATRARGGGTGMAVALVIFVLLFVVALGLAIVYMNKNEELKFNSDRATEALNEYIKPAERSSEDVKMAREAAKDAGGSDSVVGHLIKEKKTLLAMISNAGTVEVAKQTLKSKGLEGGNIVSVIDGLRADKDALDAKWKSEQKLKEDAIAEKMKTLQEKTQLETQYAEATKTRTTEVQAIDATVKAGQKTASDTFTSLQASQEEAAKKAAEEIAKKEDEKAALLAQIQTLQGKLQEYQRNTVSTGGPAPELQTDGNVLSVVPEDNIVSVDLGRLNRVYLGLTFEVFDRKKGVSKDQFGDVRGKASIEVVKIKEASCECRIVRTDRGAAILEGDLVANVVYDKYRVFKFYVYGEFDLNNDGTASTTDTRRIVSLVEQWGGTAAKQMAYDVDFLVLGKRPSEPKPLKEGEVETPEEIARRAAEAAAHKSFLELEGLARTYKIPILNQNRFLTLIGYYERQ